MDVVIILLGLGGEVIWHRCCGGDEECGNEEEGEKDGLWRWHLVWCGRGF